MDGFNASFYLPRQCDGQSLQLRTLTRADLVNLPQFADVPEIAVATIERLSIHIYL
jgi:hypothetical protein